jgi:WD40 repeat protein
MRTGQALGGQGWLLAFTGQDALRIERLGRLNLFEPPSRLPSGQYADTVAADPLGRWVAAAEGDKIIFFGTGNDPQGHVVALPATSIAVVPQTDGRFVFALIVTDTRRNGNEYFIFGRDAETVTGARLYRLPVPAPLFRLPPLNIEENATCRISGNSPDFRLPEKPLELTIVARLAPGSTLPLEDGWGDAGNFLTKERFSYVSKYYENEKGGHMAVTYDSDTGEVYRLAFKHGLTGLIAAGPIEHYGTDGQGLRDIEARGNEQSFTARNGRLVALYQDGNVQVWQIKPHGESKTYKLLGQFHDDWSFFGLSALSADGRYVHVGFESLSGDGPDEYSTFRLDSGEQVGDGKPLTPFPGRANRGVVADIRPHRLAVWDYDKGGIVARLPRQRSRNEWGGYAPLRAAISDDGRLVASASYDGLVRVWDIDARRMIGEGRVGSEVTAMAFDLAGRRLAAGKEDSEIVIFEIPAAK